MKYSQQRRQAVLETAGRNESERAESCRRRGFYPQQVTARPEMTAARRLEPFYAIRVNGGMRSSHAIECRKCCFGHYVVLSTTACLRYQSI